MEYVEIVRIVEFVLVTIIVLWYVAFTWIFIMAVEAIEERQEDDDDTKPFLSRFMGFVLIALGTVVATLVYLAYLLHRGIQNRSYKDVNHWLIVQAALLALGLLDLLLEMFRNPIVLVKRAIPIAYRTWSLLVVKEFHNKLSEEGMRDVEATVSYQQQPPPEYNVVAPPSEFQTKEPE